jgi:hypothetical protein
MKNKLFYVVIFAALGFLLLQFPVNNLIGTKARLTFFDMFYPVSGAFLGSGFGFVAVILMQAINIAFHGFSTVSTVSVLTLLATSRFVSMGAGAFAFSRRDKWSLVLPLASILVFLANPVGRAVWYFAILWVIPLAVSIFRKKSLLANSIFATFSSHAVGGALWIWAFHTTPAYWQMLIPIVILERSIFALGISANYILLNNVFEFVKEKRFIPVGGISIDRKYLLKFPK